MITAEVIADSVSAVSGVRLTTMALVYPKYIHGELMTHRAFSRNARSSRAVPVAKILQEVATEPVLPVIWGSNRAGMQAGEELEGTRRLLVERKWRDLAGEVSAACAELADLGLHKQWANRPLEPFSHIFTLVTSVYWRNWYQLRRHEDAQPDMKALADAMHAAHLVSEPRTLHVGEWHLPYVDDETRTDAERLDLDIGDATLLCRVSAARCARVSYRTFENRRPTFAEDLTLFGRLMFAQPLHASPAEHQATPDTTEIRRPQWGNFWGWVQFRKTLPGEDGADFDCGIPGVL